MEHSRKKILYISTNSDLGGVSKYLLEIVSKLPDNIEPYFIMSSPGYLSEELKALGIKDEQIFFVPMTNNIFNVGLHFKSNIEALKTVRKIQPDLIHCNATTGAIVGAVCGAVTGIPVIYTVHGWPFTNGISKWKQVFYKILEFLICKVYKKIICVSEYDRQIGINALPMYKNKMVTIHNGIADISEEYRKVNKNNLPAKGDELKIVMISRFCPQKDPYTLINAVKELVEEGYNIKLDLFGYGNELNRVLETIKTYNIDNIKYKGEISDVAPILKNYDVYALISNWEGLPIGIIEAMRAGLPILVSDVGGNSECIRDNGYTVYRQDITDCKQKIKIFWDKRNDLKIMGNSSRNFYEEEFSAEKIMKETMKAYGV